MTANEITFGIEIETTIPRGLLSVGGHGCGTAIPTMPGWKADRDPSINTSCDREACEFVSPIYKGTEGLLKLVEDIRTIKAMGAEVNASCGLHIHVGFDRSNVEATKRLASLVSNFEKAIYASTGTKARERGRWCAGLNRHGSAEVAIQNSRSNRYHVCNLGSEHPTVEFRAFSASTNPLKVVGYVRMCIALVERALSSKRQPSWNQKPVAAGNSAHRSGEGQTALCRFFYAMGWTKGRVDHVFGNLIGEGLPLLQSSKRELTKLARKYDSDEIAARAARVASVIR